MPLRYIEVEVRIDGEHIGNNYQPVGGCRHAPAGHCARLACIRRFIARAEELVRPVIERRHNVAPHVVTLAGLDPYRNSRPHARA